MPPTIRNRPARPAVSTPSAQPPKVDTPAAPRAPGKPAPAAQPSVGNTAWKNFSGAKDGLPTEAWMDGFSTPLLDRASNLVRFTWEKPGDTIPFEMNVFVKGDLSKLRAEVYTNANHNASPGTYDAIPMNVVDVKDEAGGKRVTLRADVPVTNVGNYRATGRLSVDGGQSFQWAGQRNIQDIRFRPRDDRFDNLNMVELNVGNVNFNSQTGKMGTFADLMDSGSPQSNGKYTLEWMKSQGKDTVWLMPPFEIAQWDQRHPMDTAGSPYAVKDFFSIRTEFSRAAQGLTGEAARDAAMKEFQAFMKKAHDMGMKVVLDVPLNHVGHNYEFRDLFTRYTQAGQELREVRKNDFSQLTLNGEQTKIVQDRLNDPTLPKYFEYIMPWMYEAKDNSPLGAQRVEDIAPGGHTEWFDTKQLRHGRQRAGEIGRSEFAWWDEAPAAKEEKALQSWLGRIMQFWTVDMGVDGFRIDHLTGLPMAMLEEQANLVQAEVDKRSPGKTVYLMGEDFNTPDATRPWTDNLQGGFFHTFLHARSQEDFAGAVNNSWFKDLENLDSHDEERFIDAFGGANADYRAAGRQAAILQLLGGPTMSVAGGEFGENNRIPFKAYLGIPTMHARQKQQEDMAAFLGKVGRSRLNEPALQDDNRAFLQPRVGGRDPDLVALSRWPDAKNGGVVLVFANMNNGQTRENAFQLDGETRSRIDPNKRYQVRNLLADDPGTGLWNPPLTGQELLDKGVFTRLSPYEMQALKLDVVG